MPDFVTRLAERAMGAAPIVRPMIAPKFAPEPDGPLTDPTSGNEPFPEEPNLVMYERILRAAPPSETLVSNHTATTRNDADDTPPAQRTTGDPGPPAGPAPPERDSGPAPRGTAPDATDSRERDRGPLRNDPPVADAGFGSEDPGYAPSPVPDPARRPSDPGPGPSAERRSRRPVTRRRPQGPHRPVADDRPLREGGSETPHHVEPAPARRGAPEKTRHPKPERPPSIPSATEEGPSWPGTARPTVPLAKPAATPPREAANAPAGAQAALPAVVPKTIPEGIQQQGERGPMGTRRPEPEPPAPTIRVSIGRIEVRAVTPPPPAPPRRERVGPSSPPLSLDDYLKQRGGGRR